MTQIRISLLGSFQVQRAGALVTRFRGDKVRALLAYLAVEPAQPFTRSALAGLLWPEQEQQQALRNLTQALVRMGEALGELPLHVTRQTIQWRVEAAEVDVLLFSQLAHSRETADLAQAAALYRGELLAGFSLPGCEAFEEWLLLTREHLLQELFAALDALAEQHLAAGRFTHAAGAARRQLELDPWREAAHRQLMRALVLGGDRAAALAQYAHCCQVFEAALGVEPDEQTHALYEQIRTNRLQLPAPAPSAPAVPPSAPTPPPDRHVRGEAPEPGRVYGREAELALLRRWLLDEQCQVVALLGIGGVGKTTLAAVLAHSVAEQFELLFWRSLLNAPPLDELLRPLLQDLTGQVLTMLPTSLDDQLALLLDYLRKRCCLLILDNFESLIDADGSGRMRPGYEGYAQLLQRLAYSRHRSCLLLTSRERTQGMARWEADLAWVRALRLEGLDAAASAAILNARGVQGQRDDAQALIERYSGHPLALKLVAETVHELFGGAIDAFLREESLFFDDIRAILDQQWSRLSALEQEILLWLAVEREPVTVAELRVNLVPPPPSSQFLEALSALQRRSLLEQREARFSLQNVVTEYLTARLIDGVCAEIVGARWSADAGLPLLNRVALCKAQAKEYVRQSQARLILQPVAEQLVRQLGLASVATHIQTILEVLRETVPRAPGYAAGNLLNLLLHLGIDASGYDFSQLSVWQADLRGVALAALNFNRADLADSVFTLDFSTYAIRLEQSGQVTVAAPFKGGLWLWRVANGQLHDGFQIANLSPYPLVFSPDGRSLAGCCADHSVRIWSVETGSQLQLLQGHAALVDSLAFSHDAQLLASIGLDHTVRVWDVRSGRCVQILSQQHPSSRVLAFQPQIAAANPARVPLLASTGSDRTIWLWDLRSGQVVEILQGHTREIQSMAFSPDGTRLVSGAHDGTILLWDVRAAGHAELLGALYGHSSNVPVFAFHPAGQLLASGGADQTIRLWDIRDGRPRQILTGHMSEVGHLSFRPDGQVLASCSADRVIKLWDVRSGRAFESITGFFNIINAVCFRPDGRQLASAGGDGLIRLWDIRTGRLLRSLRGHSAQVLTLTFSPDGRLLASGGSDRVIVIWDLVAGRLRGALHGHTGAVRRLAWSPDGRQLASASADRTIRVWSAVSDAERSGRVLYGHTDEVVSIAWSPDGRALVSSSSDRTVRLWTVESGQELRALEGHTSAVCTAALSPSGTRIASIGFDSTVRLWDAESGQSEAVWSGNSARGRVVRFSPSGELLAHACEEIALAVRDLRRGDVLYTLRGHTSTIIGLDFSPTEPLLASSGWDQTIRLWNLATGECRHVLSAPAPYADMNIAGVTGITEAQRAGLVALGAVEGDAPDGKELSGEN